MPNYTLIQYLKNILPRLVQHSKDLSKTENFVDKRWVLLDSDSNIHEYFFMRNGTVRLFVNGTGSTGHWELLDQGRRMMVEVGPEIKLLQMGFIQEGLFLLKKSSSDDLAFALYDPNVVKDGDIESYIERFLSPEPDTPTLPKPRQPREMIYDTDGGILRVFLNENNAIEGQEVYFSGSNTIPPNGVYKLKKHDFIRSITIEDGKIIKLKTEDELFAAIFFGIIIFVALLGVILTYAKL